MTNICSYAIILLPHKFDRKEVISWSVKTCYTAFRLLYLQGCKPVVFCVKVLVLCLAKVKIKGKVRIGESPKPALNSSVAHKGRSLVVIKCYRHTPLRVIYAVVAVECGIWFRTVGNCQESTWESFLSHLIPSILLQEWGNGAHSGVHQTPQGQRREGKKSKTYGTSMIMSDYRTVTSMSCFPSSDAQYHHVITEHHWGY